MAVRLLKLYLYAVSFIFLSSGTTVSSLKHARPPTAFDMAAARNTPCVQVRSLHRSVSKYSGRGAAVST